MDEKIKAELLSTGTVDVVGSLSQALEGVGPTFTGDVFVEAALSQALGDVTLAATGVVSSTQSGSPRTSRARVGTRRSS